MTLDEIDALIADTRTRLAPREVPAEERESAMKELEVGLYPGDQPEQYQKSGRKEFERLKTERTPLVEQVKRARVAEQEMKDKESAWGQIKEFGKNILAPHELDFPKVPTTASPKPQQPVAPLPQEQVKNKPLEGLQSAPSSRFHVDEGEIIDTKRGEIITPDVFKKSATSQERAEIEKQLQDGGYLEINPRDHYDFAAAERNGIKPAPYERDIDPETGKARLHMDSRFKMDTHPNRFLNSELGIFDTKYSEIVPNDRFDREATPAQKRTLMQSTEVIPADETQGYIDSAKKGPQLQPIRGTQTLAREQSETTTTRYPVPSPTEIAPRGPNLFVPGITDRMARATPGERPLDRYGSMEPLSLGQAFEESGKSFLRGMGETGALGLRGIGMIRHEIDQATVPESAGKLDDYSLYKAGLRTSEMTQRLFPGREDLKDNFLLTTVPQALGSSVLFYGTGAFGAAAGINAGLSAAIPGAVVGAASMSERAGPDVSPNARRVGLFLGGLLGATEGVPIADLFRRMNTATGGTLMTALKVGTVQAIEEAIQEGVQQLGENFVANVLFEKIPGLTEGVAAGMGAGGLVGFLTGAVMARKSRYGSTLQKEQVVNGVPGPSPVTPEQVQPTAPPKPSGPMANAPFAPPPKPKQPAVDLSGIPEELQVAPAGQPRLIKKPGPAVQPSIPTPEILAPQAPETPLPPASVPGMEPSLQATPPVTPEAVVPEAAPTPVEEPILEVPEVEVRATPLEAPTVEDIHAIADAKGIPWDNDTQFMDLTEEVTGKRHLDELEPDELTLLGKVLESSKPKKPAAVPAPVAERVPEPTQVVPGTRAKEVTQQTMKVKGAEIRAYLNSLPQDEAKRAYARALVDGLQTGQMPPDPNNLLPHEIQAIQKGLMQAVASGKAKPSAVPTPDTVVDQAAHEAATSSTNAIPEPTELQKEAGNYQKGHVSISGLDISIENPQGSTRSGKDKSGKPWSITMKDHYGYIRGTKGKDKDHLDVFIKPGTPEDYSGVVFVVDQQDPVTKRFDEHKIIMGAQDMKEARAIYQQNYAKGWQGLKGLRQFSMEQFKAWLKTPDATTQPVMAYNAISEYNATSAPPTPTPETIEYTVQSLRPGATPETLTVPAELPPSKNAPPERRRSVFMGKDGQRFIEFADPIHAEMFDFDSKMKKAVRGEKDFDVEHAMARIRNGLNLPADANVGALSSQYRTEVLDAARRIGKGETYKAPAPSTTAKAVTPEAIQQKLVETAGEAPTFNYTNQGKRPTTKQILTDWRKAGKPDDFNVTYGETEARFVRRAIGNGKVRWDDEGNGAGGVNRGEVVRALQEEGKPGVTPEQITPSKPQPAADLLPGAEGPNTPFTGKITEILSPGLKRQREVSRRITIMQKALQRVEQHNWTLSDFDREELKGMLFDSLPEVPHDLSAQAWKLESQIRNLLNEGKAPAPAVTPEALATPPKKSATITPEEVANVPATTTRVRPVEPIPTDIEPVGAASERAPAPTPTEAVSGPSEAEGTGAVLPKPRRPSPERVGQPGAVGGKPRHGERGRDVTPTPAVRKPATDEVAEEAEKANPGLHDYRITAEDSLEAGGPKEKFKKNVAAIRLLKQLEQEGRLATPDEQKVLIKYVGWGGIPQAFHSSWGEWGPQYKELEALLTDDEWSSAKASTINAHYTDPATISSIYAGLARLGVKSGRLLEPGLGTGNFFGLIPSSMRFKKVGVELDDLTSRIAKQLYQHASVQHSGFEDLALPDNFFDVTVGNVPFADVKPFDKYDQELQKLRFSLHDYFFAKGMKKLRPGGIMAYITSRYTMDKQNDKVRAYLAKQADLVAAFRLPNTAFKGIANTEVVTDILFLQKRDPGAPVKGEPWLNSVDQEIGKETFRINEYYRDHPEHILGKPTAAGSMYRDKEYTVEADRDLSSALTEAMKRLPANRYTAQKPTKAVTNTEMAKSLPAPGELKNHALTIQNGTLYQKQGDTLLPIADVGQTVLARIRGMIGLRELTQEVLRTQLTEDIETKEGKAVIEKAIATLNREYDKYVKRFEPLNAQANRLAFREDPDYPMLQALEHYDKQTKKASKADIFYKPTIAKRIAPTTAGSPKDALLIAMNETNTVDFTRMKELTGMTKPQLVEALRGQIYQLPDNTWEMADAYLSGNVRQKLRDAQASAKVDDAFLENVKALEQVIPEDLPPSKIDVRIGAGWVPVDVYEQFMQETVKSRPAIHYNATVAAYEVQWRRSPDDVANTKVYGTERKTAIALFEDMLHSQRPAVYDKTDDGKRILNEKETLAALTKSEELANAFQTWVWKDTDRATRLSRIYNDAYNNTILREYDGSHLTLPGSSPLIQLRPHQKNVVWRSLQSPTLYIAHVVGAGKTFAGAAIALEHRRLGLAKKPLFAVPNHLVAHWAEEIRKLYPAANVLMTTEQDFQKENRRKLLAKVATGNWDAVVIAHSAFSRIPVGLELYKEYMEKEINALEEFRQQEAEASGKGSKIVKQIEKAKKRLESKLKARIDEQEKMADQTLFWDQLGVDMLVVDEADVYKNLYYPTRMTRIAGLPNSDSKRAFDMFLKTRYTYNINNGRGVVFMSGTPVSNTMAEAYTVQRYLQPDLLESNGLAHFDAWARQFGREVVGVEMGPTGKYRTNTRFAQFVNVPELTAQLRTVMDVKTNDDLKLDIPPVKSGKPLNITADAPPALTGYVDDLVKRAEAVKKRLVQPDQDNMLKICNDGRLAALDIRLKLPTQPDFEGSKVNRVIEGVVNIAKLTEPLKGTQLIFLDLSTPKAKDKVSDEPEQETDADDEAVTQEEQKTLSSVYDDMRKKLVAQGIKAEEVAFIHDAKNTAQKQRIFDRMNRGELRVLIGSTEKMGAGMNVQQRLVALHHVDAPWRPRDLEQRDGRIVRQGNMFYAARKAFAAGETLPPHLKRHFTDAMLANPQALEYLKNFEVSIFRYATKKPSFDLYMWQTIESKARMISQVMSGDQSMRSVEDIDVTVLSAAEMKALAADDPLTMEKISVEGQVRKLSLLRNSHEDALFSMKRDLARIPQQIAVYEADLTRSKEYDAAVAPHPKEPFSITIEGEEYTDRKEAGKALRKLMEAMPEKQDPVGIGTYRGLDLSMSTKTEHYVDERGEVAARKTGDIQAKVSPRATFAAYGTVRQDDLGAIQSLAGSVEQSIGASKSTIEPNIARLKTQEADLKKQIEKPFQYQEKLDAAEKRYKEILEALGKNESAAGAVEEEKAITPTELPKAEGGGGGTTLRGGFAIFDPELYKSKKTKKYAKEAKAYRALRAKEELVGFSSSDADIEARVRAAKQGVRPEGIWTRIKDNSEHVWRLVSREFEALPDTAQFAPLRTDLLRLAKYKGIAADRVQRDLASIIKPLSRKQYDQFEWKALLSDLVREAEQDRALPFGYTPEKVQEDLDRLNEMIANDPKVQEAWAKRQELWKTLKRDYQRAMDAIGFDTSKKLTKEDYFRHQVLEYARERALKGTGSKVRTPTGRGFLQARHGSGLDINANYVQAEFEVMAQMVYDTQVAKVIEGVDRHYNIRQQLEQEAKSRNDAAVQAIIDEGGLPGAIVQSTMKDFRNRIGMHMGMARKALQLPKGQRISLAELAEIADDPDSPAHLSARGVFKAISERKAYVKQLLGSQFMTWERLVPETHDIWQPREGNVFYMADSIPHQMAKALQEGMLDASGLTAAKLRKVLAMGNPREQYVIPVEAKATLDDLSHKEHTWFVEMNRHLLGHWKQLMLIAPRKVLRYNLRNLTGDMDAMFVGNPRAFTKLPQAAKELIPVIFKDTPLTGEAKEWADRGGYGTTLQMQELGDLNDLKAFKATLERQSKGGVLSVPAKVWNAYWKSARLSTDYREAMLRYAAYLEYLQQMQGSEARRPKNFGASIPSTVMALPDVRDRAFKLSNELLGAYDRVSVAGQTIRSFWIPFWSWQEVNATRYGRMVRNVFDGDGTGRLARGAVVGSVTAAGFLIKLAMFWSMLQAWNYGMYGDDEDELRETNPTIANRPHILFGRDDQGKIRYLAGIGALGDFLAWFGLDAAPGLVGDVMHDRLTIGEAVKQAAKAPILKILGGITPTLKIPVELLSRQSFYPDPFHPRPIQDRGDYLGQQTTFGPEISKLRGKPGRPIYGTEDAAGLVVQRTDPAGAAYSTWQGIERKYLGRMGKDESSLFWRSERGEAISNWSRAIRDQDVTAETHWQKEYERLEREKYGQKFSRTRMMADLEKSLRAKAPLAGVTKAEREQILAQLDSQERRTLEKAEAYYTDTLLQVLPDVRRRAFTSKLHRQRWLTQPTPAPHDILP